MRRILLVAIVLAASGCGYLSNNAFFTGEGNVHGRVVLDGHPLSGAQVFVVGEPERAVTTGDDGTFEISASAGSSKKLVVIWGASLGLRKEFKLAGDGDQEFGDIVLGAIGTVDGTVELDDPTRAEVGAAGTPVVTHPNESGSFRLVLPAGSYDLELHAAGYIDQTIEDLKVSSGQTTEIDPIALPPDPDHVCQGSEQRTERFSQGGGGSVDTLFIIDNSGSMVGEQQALAESFGAFTAALDEAAVDYRIAVITTGMESPACPACSTLQGPASCVNDTGESGLFQNNICRNQGTVDAPDYSCRTDPACGKIITSTNKSCFYDDSSNPPEGMVFTGVLGCGYERGLASMRAALGDLAAGENAGFMRDWARLAVVVVSDENDCGEVGDVTEGMPGVFGNACYYAATGQDPDGNQVDPEGLPYRLTPVSDYADFLRGLKPVSTMVSFSAIVGVSDLEDPSATKIEYEKEPDGSWGIVPACVNPGCSGNYCNANPGTRYIALAESTGGAIATICQNDFSQPMLEVAGASVGYRRVFRLSGDPISPDTIEVSVNGEARTDFTFDAQTREVAFDPGQAPPAYALVEIGYQAACP